MAAVSPSRRLIVVAVAVACLAAVVGVTAVATDSTEATLVVADADSGERLLEAPVEEGETVTLAYTHSVEKTAVRDVYVVGDGELEMVRMEFDSYGAGLPADADVERTEDGLVAELDRSYERVRVSPGAIAGHELVVGETRHDLVALAEDEDATTVVLFVEPRTAGGAVDALADAISTVGAQEKPPIAVREGATDPILEVR